MHTLFTEAGFMGKVIAMEGTSEEVLAQLQELKAADKSSEKTGRSGCLLALAAGAGAVIAVSAEGVPHVDLILPICGVIALIGLILFVTGQSGDIPDDRYEALERVHHFLRTDCDPKAVFSYTLDPGSLSQRRNYSHSERRYNGRWKFYYTTLLSGRVKLRDGTALQFELEKITRKKGGFKMNARGKIKYKSKQKHSDCFRLKAKLPQSRESTVTEVGSVPNRMRLGLKAPKFKCQGAKLQASAIRKRTAEQIDADGLLDLFVFSFQQLNKAS